MARTFKLQARRSGDTVDFSADLNPEQLAVATAPGGPMLVIAGAGSGKTRALTYRLAWLVAHGVDPERILLVTFTNRASREMLNRVELLLKRKTPQLWGGTFHHVANRILRLHGSHLGISPDFTILDREDSRDLLGACVVEAGVPIHQKRFPQKKVLAAISSFLQNTLAPLPDILGHRYPMFQDQEPHIQRVLALYAARKKKAQLLDYDDLLSAWLTLLKKHASVRKQLAEQFQHILVDEYQDTNAIQGEIIDVLAARHRNLCVVGDDAQSIYSFRGANFQNILRFKERYADAKAFRLETNYRSTPEILQLANTSIAHNRQRLPKNLRAVRPGGVRPALVPVHDHFIQSRFIAEYILHLLKEGRKLNDIAVLYRSHWHSMELQLELSRHNIPFSVRGGLRFFEQAHIKDVLAVLRLTHNPRDELAWRRALPLLPKIGTGWAARVWERIGTAANPLEEAGQTEMAAFLPGAARTFYVDFIRLLDDLTKLREPAPVLDQISKRFYDDYLSSHFENANLRREDLRAVADFSAQYRSCDAFLADVALAGEFSGETVVAGPDEMEFVTLSTVHQAKGLEWPVVLIPWLADGRFPTDMAINTAEELEEERRVFHVAVTRAKDELYLVVPQVWSTRGHRRVLMKPSRFLMELKEDLTEKLVIEEGLPEVTTGETSKTRALPEGSKGKSPPTLKKRKRSSSKKKARRKKDS